MRTVDRAAYEGDIVSRLRNWRGLHLAHGGDLFEEAADEIESLRLTDEEREAIEWFAEVNKPLTRLTQNNLREDYKTKLRRLLVRLSLK